MDAFRATALRRAGTAVALIALLAVPSAHADGAERHASRPYTALELVDLYCVADDGVPFVTGSGHACLDVRPNETSVNIVLEDVSGRKVPATWTFFKADGTGPWGQGVFCGAVTAPIPAGAAYLDVWPYAPFEILEKCLDGSPYTGLPTVGYVRATFA